MKELVIRCSDETYDVLHNYNKNGDQCVSIQNAISMYLWLADLLSACQLAAQRAEILKHNKAMSHEFEMKWLKKDCERYNITPEVFIETIAFGHPIRTVGKHVKDDLAGIPYNDPEREYMIACVEGESNASS